MDAQMSETTDLDITFSRSDFFCLLDDQPTYLVPFRLMLLNARKDVSGTRVINPHCWIAQEGITHPTVSAYTLFMKNFAPQGKLLWITDPATRILMPFWLGPYYSSFLVEARPGEPVPVFLPPEVESVLSFAHVLVDPDYEVRRRQEWANAVSGYISQFRKGYVPLTGLIHPYLIGALRRYYRQLVRTDRLQFGDKRSPLRFVAHNETVARFFHHQLSGVVSDIVGEPVQPSYVYFASYQSGADLTKHIDREQCEFSITFLIDASPEPERESPWPLHLDTQRGIVTLFQCIGDGLLYKGRELPHYRKKLPKGYTSTSLFFHFVRENFDGRLQ